MYVCMYVCMYVWTKKQVEQEANQVLSKIKTTYGGKKKEKLYNKDCITHNLWRINRITLQWQKNIAYY